MSDQGFLRAEQRVREMNRMTQQYAERGNRYMQNLNSGQTRFEPMNNRTGHGSGNIDPASRAPEVPVHEDAVIQTVHNDTDAQNGSFVNEGSRPEPDRRNPRNGSGQQGLTAFGIESDKLLIMAIIYLLIKENADIKIILALAYLLL
ncbi:MAG: hypothetical protein J1E40_03170 [Oscillospiraceae bacterium]|nr:hypothetical protein [Oscillospiraceae bacterium]